MGWYFDQSIKYWKYSSVTSGAIGFMYLIQLMMFPVILELFNQFVPTGYSSLLMGLFQGASAISAIFFFLFLIAGILASRGNTVGAVMSLIISMIVLLLLIVNSPSIYGGIFLFPIILFSSPQALLALFNIYYSARALKNRIEGPAISIYQFFPCSLQYCVAILSGIIAIIVIFFTSWGALAGFQTSSQMLEGNLPLPLSAMIGITGILLFTFFILTFYSGHIIFNSDEETLPKKRIYILSIISIIILLIITGVIPIFGPLLAFFTIPFVVLSLGFIVAIPKKKSIIEAETVRHEMPSQVFPERITVREIHQEYVSEPKPMKTVGIRYCRYCGRIIPADSIYCEHCGRRLR